MAGELQPIQIKIQANGADEATKSIMNVTNALKELQAVSGKVSNVMTNFGNNINKTNIKNTFNDFSNANLTNIKNINKVNNSTKKLSSRFNTLGKSGISVIATLFTMQKASKYLRQSFNESSSWVENLNVMEVAFGNLSNNAYQFTKSVSNKFGLDANELLEYVSLFQQMASAMGQSTETAYQMSTALTLLGTDVASLYNKDVKVTMEALRSAIAGQVKPVRQFGFDITSYSIDGLIEQMGILEGYTSRMMTQSQKQLARTILLIQQSKNAWGDLGKTLDTYSNQQKILTSQFANLKRAIGDLFIGTKDEAGIATRVLYALNGAVMAIVETIRAFIPEASSSGFNEVQEDLKKTEDEMEGLEEATSGALLSFDKFNTLSKGEGKGNEWITSQLEKLLSDEYAKYLKEWNARMETVSSKAHEIRDNIMQILGFTKETTTTIMEGGIELTNVNFKLKEGITLAYLIKEAAIYVVSVITAKSLVSALKTIITLTQAWTVSTLTLAKAQNVLLYGSMFLLIKNIIQLKEEWDNMNTTSRMFQTVVISVWGSLTLLLAVMKAFNLAEAKKMMSLVLGLILKFGSWQKAILNCSTAFLGFSILIAGIITLMQNWGDMKGWQKVVTILTSLTAAALAAALAIGVFNTTWTMGLGAAAIVAGIGLIIGSMASVQSNIKGYANGGYPDKGQMFIANEKGPELVGNIGGRTAVANNDMIVQAIENASYRGMIRATQSNGGSNNVNLKIDANSNDLSRALAKSMAIELKRQGYSL